ncbi:MAG: hypothetical protein PHU23_16645 [Dehalococcoidales bacterium]|nr:hypothetical protein [Dehalococcoidales bacterium]
MDRLALILVDMLRSALAWEKEHGVWEGEDALTSIPKPYTLLPPEIKKKEEKDDSSNASQDKKDS